MDLTDQPAKPSRLTGGTTARLGGGGRIGGSRAYWICQLVGWGGAWVMGLVGDSAQPHVQPHELVNNTIFIGSTFIGSILLRWIVLELGWHRLEWKAILPRLLATIGCYSGLQSFLFITYLSWSGAEHHEGWDYWLNLAMVCLIVNMMLIAWSGLYLGYQYQKRLKDLRIRNLELEAARKDSEHRALRAQVNPHFLFNSLNTIRSLIDEDPAKARQAVTELARMFRASLQTNHEAIIPLREELETLHAYLSLEQVRFEDRLCVEAQVDPDALDAPVPPFLLQTLVENGIKYGISTREEGGVIKYEAKLDPDRLVIRVTNPGKIVEKESATKMGLANARKRLNLLFGDKSSLQLSNLADNLVLAEVIIPFCHVSLCAR